MIVATLIIVHGTPQIDLLICGFILFGISLYLIRFFKRQIGLEMILSNPGKCGRTHAGWACGCRWGEWVGAGRWAGDSTLLRTCLSQLARITSQSSLICSLVEMPPPSKAENGIGREQIHFLLIIIARRLGTAWSVGCSQCVLQHLHGSS